MKNNSNFFSKDTEDSVLNIGPFSPKKTMTPDFKSPVIKPGPPAEDELKKDPKSKLIKGIAAV
jgi:hypothetical protein